MLVPFLIVLREGIEAALIVGIIASYLRHTGRSEWLVGVWIGICLAIALALFVGAGLEFASAEFPQKQVELFEAIVGFIAVIVLSSMIFWMKSISKSIGGQLRTAVDKAINNSKNQILGLVFMVFLAVAREGLETLFFLLALIQQTDGIDAPLGATLGLAASFCVGIGLYKGSLKINLSYFFKLTSLLIVFVSAGILANSVKALHEAGIWNYGQTLAFDISQALPADGPVGTVLAGLVGYQDTPTVSAFYAWLVYLGFAFYMYVKPIKAPSSKEVVV